MFDGPAITSRTTLFSVVLLIVASCGSTAPSSHAAASSSPVTTASPSASPLQIPPLSVAFASPAMGYSVKYPAGWTVTLATESWPVGHTSYWDTPDGDRLEGGGAGFRGTSQALAPGQTPAEWINQYMASSLSCGKREQVPVANELGTIDLNDCTGLGRLGGRVFDIAVVSGGRGYNFTMEGKVDRGFFLAMLATVTFRPQAAKA